MFKTREEVETGSQLFLDMVEDARILHFHDGFLAGYLDRRRPACRNWFATRLVGQWLVLVPEARSASRRDISL